MVLVLHFFSWHRLFCLLKPMPWVKGTRGATCSAQQPGCVWPSGWIPAPISWHDMAKRLSSHSLHLVWDGILPWRVFIFCCNFHCLVSSMESNTGHKYKKIKISPSPPPPRKPDSTRRYPGCFLSKVLILYFIATLRSGGWKEIFSNENR